MKRFWSKWLIISKKLAGFLANILLFIIYCIFIIPIGFFMKTFFAQRLLGHEYKKNKNTFWMKKKKTIYDLMWAKEQ